MSSLVDRHNVRSLALNIVMKPVPTLELLLIFEIQPLSQVNNNNISRMNVGGTEKSWAELEQAELVYP